MTPVFCCGFECGQFGAVGQHWDSAASPFLSTTIVRNGLRSLNISGNATNRYTNCTLLQASTMWVIRCGLYFSTVPSTTCKILGLSGYVTGLHFNSVDSKLYLGNSVSDLGATGISVTTGIWYLVDLKINSSANPWVMDAQIDGVALAQKTNAVAAASPTRIIIGNSFTAADLDIYFDDVVISQTSADYPIGDGKILSYVPNVDGTHTCTTTTIVKGTAAAPTAGGNVAGATDVFNWVNARPIGGGATDATRLVNQQTAASTLYAEVGFEDSAESNPPRAVEVLAVDKQAATAAGDFAIKLKGTSATESVIIQRLAAAGVITDRYTSKQFATEPVTASAWTTALFNALKMRFGYSGDATPDQYWRGAMIEAEFPIGAAPAATQEPLILLGVG